MLGLLIGLPLLAVLIFGQPVTLEIPVLSGFNFAGGSRVIPEFVALTLALSTYTAAFIAEIVRAGIMSVHKGQMEAGSSLGLQRGRTLRLIVVPQALRVILPPLTNQYLNLTKNSSLAVAIGYPDLVSVFAGTTLSQTGQAIEIIAITMGVYLLISLVTSAIMSFYGWRHQPEHGGDERRPVFVRQDLVARAPRAGEDHRLRRLPAHAPVQLADQHPDHHRQRAAAVVHPRSRDQVHADRCGVDRQGPRRVPCRKDRPMRSAPAGRSSRQNSASSSTASIRSRSAGGSTSSSCSAAVLLLPLLIPRLPGKGINAGLFFVAFPVVAFFLLHGGGLKGFGVSWTAELLSGFNDSIGEGGDKLVTSGECIGRDRAAAVAARQAARADLHRDLLDPVAADLAARPDPVASAGRSGPISSLTAVDRLGADVLARRRLARRLAPADHEPRRSSPASASSSPSWGSTAADCRSSIRGCGAACW